MTCNWTNISQQNFSVTIFMCLPFIFGGMWFHLNCKCWKNVMFNGKLSSWFIDFMCICRQFAGNNDEVYCVRFFGTDDRSIAVATNSSAIKIFDVSTWSCQIVTGHTDIVMSLDTHDSDGTTYMVSGGKVSVLLEEVLHFNVFYMFKKLLPWLLRLRSLFYF